MYKAPETTQESIDAGYEVSDMNAAIAKKLIAGLMIMLFCGVGFIVIYLRIMQSSITPHATKTDYPMLDKIEVSKPLPELQQDPSKDRAEFLAEADEQLNHYGQVRDEEHAEHVIHSHIPIDRAIELVASGKAQYRQEPAIALEADDSDEADPLDEL